MKEVHKAIVSMQRSDDGCGCDSFLGEVLQKLSLSLFNQLPLLIRFRISHVTYKQLKQP